MLVEDHYDLCRIGEFCHEQQELIISTVMNDLELLNKIFAKPCVYIDFCAIGQSFPKYHHIMINALMSTIELFDKLISPPSAYIILCSIAEKFPTQHDAIIERITRDFESFNKVVTDYISFCGIGKTFKNHQNRLINYVDKHNQAFFIVVSGYISFKAISEDFGPSLASTLLPGILKKIDRFTAVISNSFNLNYMATLMPSYAEQFMIKLLKTYEFKEFFTDLYKLYSALEVFPGFKSIFDQPSLDTAKEAADKFLKDLKLISKSTIYAAACGANMLLYVPAPTRPKLRQLDVGYSNFGIN